MCGQGARLGLLLFDPLESQSYDFDEIAQTKPLYGEERLLKNFYKPCRVFEKIEKVQKWRFFGHFGANFGYVSHIPAIRI